MLKWRTLEFKKGTKGMSIYRFFGFPKHPCLSFPSPRLNRVKVEMPNVGLDVQGLLYLKSKHLKMFNFNLNTCE